MIEEDKKTEAMKLKDMTAGVSAAEQAFIGELAKISALGIEPGLAVITELLRHLGEPQKNLAVIHVTGTNGKGSVCAMLEACLREAGYRTGLYSSPHMISYAERIRVDGKMIAIEDMALLLPEVRTAAERTEETLGKRPTEFELLTAMAFVWFCRQKVEVLVLEVGMGGRFDATNVFPEPLATVITGISRDHEAYMGDTVQGIAWEKAGIIKAGVPLVTACADAKAFAVIRREFDEAQKDKPGARLIQVQEKCRWTAKSRGLAGQEIDLDTPGRAWRALFLPLAGQYQCVNLAGAVLTLELLAEKASPLPRGGARLTEEAIRKGLASVRWPCRLEAVQEKPLVVLDGSHNPEGISELALWLSGHRGQYDQVILVMGMVEDKDRLAAAEKLDGLASRLIITKPLPARAGRWQDLAAGFRRMPEGSVAFVEDCHQALKQAIAAAGENDLVLCTGSFYLVGELRRNWMEKGLFSA